VGLCDIVDEFLDQNGLADAGTTKETDFTTTSIGCKEVDNLDTSFEDLCGSGLVDKSGRVCMDGREFDTVDGTSLVDGFTDDVHDTTQGGLSDWDLDGSASVDDLCAADETLCTVHSDGADGVFTEVGGYLENETTAVKILDLKGIENWGEGV